jgi:hypothetical protein
MLKRNISSILSWTTDELALRLDNGIWDLICSTYSNHNVLIPLEYYELYVRSICHKGKRAFAFRYTVGFADPSPIIHHAYTSIISHDDGGFYYILPFFDEVIEFDHMIEEGHIRQGTVKQFFNLVGKDYVNVLKRVLEVTYQLERLGLKNPFPGQVGHHILFGISEGRAEILIDTGALQFDLVKNLGELGIMSDYIGKILNTREEIQLNKSVIDYDNILHYDFPKWSPKGPLEIGLVKYLVGIYFTWRRGVWPQMGEEFESIVKEYNQYVDNLMGLICWGHAEELYNMMKAEEKLYVDELDQLNKLYEKISKLSAKYYQQLPYRRVPFVQLKRDIVELDEKYLSHPNFYREEYNKFRTNNGKAKIYPTNPQEDRMYSLEEISGIQAYPAIPAPIIRKDTYDLHVTELPKGNIKINGIEFKSKDLIIFYNTQFYDITTSLNEKDITIPYIKLDDLRLIKDLLEGRIMVQTFSRSLSEGGVVFFGGDRTFYQLISSNFFMFNQLFSFGERFIKQLRDIQLVMATSDLLFPEDIRWNEFVEIIKSSYKS